MKNDNINAGDPKVTFQSMSCSRQEEPQNNGVMSLSGHLRELRNRVLVCVVFLIASLLVGLGYSSQIVDILLELGEASGYDFIYTAPQELMLQYFFVAFIFGICVTLPVILYEIWAFIRPGLKKNENLLFLISVIFGLLCFCVGVVFAYGVILPFTLNFLITLDVADNIRAYISIQNYLSFLLTVMMIFGVIFEMPVVTAILNSLGLLKVRWMILARRAVIVLIFVLAAIITPPDAISQVIVAIPMIGLYELSILICSLLEKRKSV